MNIHSLDKQVDELISTIRNTDKLGINELLKAKVSFQLTKVNFGLRLVNRVMKLYALQERIEDRLLSEDMINDMSVRELLVMNSVNSKRLDNYYGKMDKILSSLNLRDLENSLLMINEMDNQEALEGQVNSEDGKQLKNLSLQLLSTLSTTDDLTNQLNQQVLDQANNQDDELEVVPLKNDGSLDGYNPREAHEHDQIVNELESVDDFDIDVDELLEQDPD